MTIATFEHKRDTVPVPKSVPWPRLSKALSKHEVRADKDCKLWSPVQYRAGGKRQSADVECVSCYVLDVDNGMAPDEFMARWKADGISFALHSTHSSTEECPKWRAVFPLEEPVSASEWPWVWEKLDVHVGMGMGDPSCKDASRMYYMPAHPEGAPCFAYTFEGRALDPDEYADIPKTDEQRARLNGSGRPGDEYDRLADWEPLMDALGMHSPKRYGKMTVWTRSGKKDGISARTGEGTAGDRFYCWSSSVGVVPGKLYTKFGLYAHIYHRGDYAAAAKALAALGYGEKPTTRSNRMPRDWGSGDRDLSEIRAEDRGKKFAGLKSLGEVEREEVRFLVEPYIRSGQINLLDAKGGSGKTTFGIALGACGSNGFSPVTGEPCEPWKTLYFHTEDSPGEMAHVYDETGGNRDGQWVIPWTEPMELDEDGLAELDDMLTYFKPGLIVFDAITYYLPARIKAAFDNIAISRVLNGLREVVRAHGVACLNIRHFKQGRQGLSIEDWGTGGEAWRNSHRSQLVMVPSQTRKRTSAIFHTKGSLVSATGAPFGFTFDCGEFRWERKIDPAEFGIDDERFSLKAARGDRGPEPAKMQDAMNALVSVLFRGPVHYGAAKDLAMKKAECSERLLRDAARKLGIVYNSAAKTWGLPEGFDAFEHPGIPEGGSPQWWHEK